MKNWQKIYKTEIPYQAEIVKGVLEDNDIKSVILNKKDSSYNNFGALEVLVMPDDVIRAKQIVENDIKFE